MRIKVTLTKNFGMKTSTEQSWNTDSNSVIKQSKAVTQEIWKMSILYSKTLKFYHQLYTQILSSLKILENYNEHEVGRL